MKAYKVLEKFGFCKGDYAKDTQGFSVDPRDNRAVAFCTVGAIRVAYVGGPEFIRMVNKVKAHVQMPVADWNDAVERTKSEVVKMLKELDI